MSPNKNNDAGSNTDRQKALRPPAHPRASQSRKGAPRPKSPQKNGPPQKPRPNPRVSATRKAAKPKNSGSVRRGTRGIVTAPPRRGGTRGVPGLAPADPPPPLNVDNDVDNDATIVESPSNRPQSTVAEPGRRAELVEQCEEVFRNDPLFSPLSSAALKILDKLGEGGMGIVHRVRDHRLGREAALKVLRDANDVSHLERFKREAKLTARLDHPSIPPIFEFGSLKSGQPYMLMRIIEGKTLRDLIVEEHKDGEKTESQPRKLLEILVKVSDAISYAHSRGIIHRDLKPQNIMVGRFGDVMVVDWGLGREVDQGDGASEAGIATVILEPGELSEEEQAFLTHKGTVLGTPGYMPPEQAQGLPATRASDVFALGSVLTEILTGRPSVVGERAAKRVVRTIKGDIDSPRDIQSKISKELDALASKALAVSMTDRPSAEEFGNDLRAYLAGEDLSCYKYGSAARLARRISRSPGLALSLFFLSIIVVVVINLPQRATNGAIGKIAVPKNGSGSDSELSKQLAAKQEELNKTSTELTKNRRLVDQLRKATLRLEAEAGQKAAAQNTAAESNAFLFTIAQIQLMILRGQRGEEVGESIDSLRENARGDLSRALTVANLYLQAELPDRAIQELKRASTKHSPWLPGLIWHGVLIDSSQQPFNTETEASAMILKRASQGTNTESIGMLFQSLEIAKTRPKEGLVLLNKALKKSPGLPELFHARALIYEGLGQFDKAILDAKRVIDKAPFSARAYILKARLHLKDGNAAQAEKLCSQALRRNVNNFRAFLLRAQARIDLNKNRAALSDCEAILKSNLQSFLKNHQRANLLTLYSHVLAESGKLSEAMTRVTEALKLESGNNKLLTLRATILGRQGEYRKAERAYMVIRRRSESAEATYGHALATLGLKNFKYALSLLNICLKAKDRQGLPLDLVYFHMGLASRGLGDDVEASLHFQRATRLNSKLRGQKKTLTFQRSWSPSRLN
ncbi:MAG: protein kinase [Planctomycetota bacterium]|nr:protein kinase [Planctomycetota bacterium]